jgi:hypothetical protein
MKPMKLVALLPLALVSFPFAQGQDIEKRMREGLAYSRLVAALRMPTVTPDQCSALLFDWQQKDKRDRQDSPSWMAHLSTEELHHLRASAVACESLQMSHSHSRVALFALYGSRFCAELLSRAESVLHDHALTEDFLLQP